MAVVGRLEHAGLRLAVGADTLLIRVGGNRVRMAREGIAQQGHRIRGGKALMGQQADQAILQPLHLGIDRGRRARLRAPQREAGVVSGLCGGESGQRGRGILGQVGDESPVGIALRRERGEAGCCRFDVPAQRSKEAQARRGLGRRHGVEISDEAGPVPAKGEGAFLPPRV